MTRDYSLLEEIEFELMLEQEQEQEKANSGAVRKAGQKIKAFFAKLWEKIRQLKNWFLNLFRKEKQAFDPKQKSEAAQVAKEIDQAENAAKKGMAQSASASPEQLQELRSEGGRISGMLSSLKARAKSLFSKKKAVEESYLFEDDFLFEEEEPAKTGKLKAMKDKVVGWLKALWKKIVEFKNKIIAKFKKDKDTSKEASEAVKEIKKAEATVKEAVSTAASATSTEDIQEAREKGAEANRVFKTSVRYVSKKKEAVEESYLFF